MENDISPKKQVRHVYDLLVYQKAYNVSLELHKFSLALPQIEQYNLAQQIRSASKSICVNLAEGFAKQSSSKVEFKRFVRISLGSAEETKVWLDYCKDLGYLNESQYSLWHQAYVEIAKMLQGMLKNWK
jgi:four helix bundle protein